MARDTVRVTGLRELQKALKDAGDKASVDDLKRELAELAQPVAAEVKQRLGRYGGNPASGVKVKTRARDVAVSQSRRKTTGLRPDFGSLQMRVAFVPALSEKTDEVVRGVEEWIDGILDRQRL